MTDTRELGRIVRVQIQRSSLKLGPPKGRYFDPAPLLEVGTLDVDTNGVTADVNGDRMIDVHNATHPESKYRNGINPLSFGFTDHYRRMRDTFADHLVNGIAGENILIENERLVELDDVISGVLILGDDGRRIELRDISVAHPCVEFSRFALGDPAADPATVSAALRFLGDGMRGYYAAVASATPLRIEPGDRVLALVSSNAIGKG